MILHHVQRHKTKGISINDSLVAMTAYLVSNQFIMENAISGFVDIYDSLYYKLDDAGFVYVQLLRFPEDSIEHQNLLKIYNILTGEEPVYFNDESYEAYRKIKSHTIKWRADDKKNHDDVISANKFGELVKLIDSKRILTKPILQFKETGIDEDPYIEYLKNILCETDNIPVLTLERHEYCDSLSFESIKDMNNIEKLPGYISILLYRFPDISDLSVKSLNAARENILRNIKSFNRQIVDLHEICSQLKYEPLSWQAIRQLLKEKLLGIKELQQAIEKENLIQPVKNPEKIRHAEVSLCLSSLEMIAGYYMHTGMLEAYVADVLSERLERTGNLSRCGLFFNIHVSESG